jgi:hypothetical protein
VPSRTRELLVLAATVALGIVSRLLHTGLPIIDKYLGDALYAAMVYQFLRLWSPSARTAWVAMAVMTSIELFQLTLIPAHMMGSDSLAVRTVARLLGTQSSCYDLAAYAVGIYTASRLASL